MKKSLLIAGIALMSMFVCMHIADAANASYDVVITADNHYKLFYGDTSAINFVGQNELTYEGNPGEFNWSLPESFSFEVAQDDYIYIAAWSDDNVAQGLLAEFVSASGPFEDILSGTTWEYYNTGNNFDTGAEPSNALVLTEIQNAQWAPVFYTKDNGDSPWGTIAGISADADWMWGAPLEPGSNAGEFSLYRTKVTPVPEPATMAMLGLSTLGLAAFRRKK